MRHTRARACLLILGLVCACASLWAEIVPLISDTYDKDKVKQDSRITITIDDSNVTVGKLPVGDVPRSLPGDKELRIIANLQGYKKGSGGTLEAIGVFTKPMEISIEYLDVDVKRAGGKAENLRLYMWLHPLAEPGNAKVWVPVDDPNLKAKYGVELVAGRGGRVALLDTRARCVTIRVKAWPVNDLVIAWDG
jgi:hypothetical protein